MTSKVTPLPEQTRRASDIVEAPRRERERRIDRAVLVADMARYSEGLKSEQLIRSEHLLFAGDWDLLIEDADLIAEVEIAVAQRKTNGEYFKEAAAEELAHAPRVLGAIIRDERQPARSRIDASKELRVGALGQRDDKRSGAGSVTVHINLGNRTLSYTKELVPQVVNGDEAIDVTNVGNRDQEPGTTK